MSKFFATPETKTARQAQIVPIPGFRTDGITHAVYPEVERDLTAFAELCEPGRGFLRGLDLEFYDAPFSSRSRYVPTIVAVTTEDRIASVPASEDARNILGKAFTSASYQWVAHSGISADKVVIEDWLGIKTPLAVWEDSMQTHYLCNQELTKAPSKDDTEDSGALGFMNLWTMMSLVTDMWNWKECRGLVCDGPCPEHDPEGYCGVDAWAGLVGYTEHLKTMAANQVPYSLYRENMELTEICFEMEQNGVKVNLPFVHEMEATSDRRKLELFPLEGDLNPNSQKQVLTWFKDNGINLPSNSKKDVIATLEKVCGMPIKEIENLEEPLPPNVQRLYDLYEYKTEGKGLQPWFSEKYMGRAFQDFLKRKGIQTLYEQPADTLAKLLVEGGPYAFVHPRFITVGTSTGRLSSSRPNFQNVPKRGFGDLVRRAIVARDGSLELLKSDFKNLELRMCLYHAGVDQSAIGKDAFAWLVDQAGDLFARAAQLVNPKKYAEDPKAAMRDIAKRIAHAGDYMEGIKIMEPWELAKDRVKRMIEAGALRVYTRKYYPQLKRDWEFMGGIVCFTGVNLADSLFGSHGYEERRQALEIQEDIYFKSFWFLREKFHMRVLDEIQNSGIVKSPTGRFLRLFGSPEDRAKVAAAFLGQGTSADHVQAVMIRYKRELGVVPLLQVHDELVFEIPQGWTDQQARDHIQIMNEETWRLPGFAVPSDLERGPNWKDLRKL